MDPRERYVDEQERLRIAGSGRQARLWTAFPGVIQSFNSVEMTCEIQPTIQGIHTDQIGATSFVNLPLLVDCPVQMPRGGGCVATFPIASGDECLVVIASRCIDAWWQNGGIQPPLDIRMHDLSDGFCIPGIASLPNVVKSYNTQAAELRSLDNTTKIAVNPVSKMVSIFAPNGLSIVGNVTVTGTIMSSGDQIAGTVSQLNHVHSYLPGTGAYTESSAPIPGT
jgi:hypothetical protein